jgi:hypothetical protein
VTAGRSTAARAHAVTAAAADMTCLLSGDRWPARQPTTCSAAGAGRSVEAWTGLGHALGGRWYRRWSALLRYRGVGLGLVAARGGARYRGPQTHPGRGRCEGDGQMTALTAGVQMQLRGPGD